MWQLEQHEAVETATVFNAVIMPPFHRFPYLRGIRTPFGPHDSTLLYSSRRNCLRSYVMYRTPGVPDPRGHHSGSIHTDARHGRTQRKTHRRPGQEQ